MEFAITALCYLQQTRAVAKTWSAVARSALIQKANAVLVIAMRFFELRFTHAACGVLCTAVVPDVVSVPVPFYCTLSQKRTGVPSRRNTFGRLMPSWPRTSRLALGAVCACRKQWGVVGKYVLDVAAPRSLLALSMCVFQW